MREKASRGTSRSVDRGACRPAIEPRKNFSPGCRRCSESGRQNGEVRECEHPVDPAWSKTLACMEAPCAGTGRSPTWPFGTGKGPHRKGEEPKPMMHEREKSDPFKVGKKPANNPGQLGAESVDRREGAEGNAVEPRTCRTPSRESVLQGLDRVRQAAKARKKERFTALLHHVSVELLKDAYSWLKRDAATGPHHVGTNDSTRSGFPAGSAHPSSVAPSSLCRHSPEVGARCVNRARRDLCGGYRVTGIPTAIPNYDPEVAETLRGPTRPCQL
jgi:hypothetical protein